MDEIELNGLKQSIEDKEIVSKKKLEAILNFFPAEQIDDNIICYPLTIKNTGDSIRERDFLKLLLQHIVVFVIDYDEYRRKGMTENEFVQKISDLFLTAKNKFQSDNEKTGEIGELILFMLLETNNITQIVSKMRLKTNKNMPIHGPDAVHVEVREGNIIFYYGEAKMYQNFNAALDSSIDSISKLDITKEDFEFDIIKKHIDQSKFGIFTSKILDYLDPYYKNKENMFKSYPTFIGYDWNVLKDLTQANGQNLTEFLNQEFTNSLTDKYATIKTKIQDSKIKKNSFLFYLLPFKNVNEFRKMFLEILN